VSRLLVARKAKNAHGVYDENRPANVDGDRTLHFVGYIKKEPDRLMALIDVVGGRDSDAETREEVPRSPKS